MIMTVRRGVARFATVGTLLAGLLAVGAAPATADDPVRLRLPDKFTVGGSPGAVGVVVSRKEGDCEPITLGLTLRLDGLAADDVRLEVSFDGRWRPLSVSADGDDAVAVERFSPYRPMLCEKKRVVANFRVTFLAGAPDGKVKVVAEAYGQDGDSLEADSDTAKVVGGGRAASPTPSRGTPSPTPEATEEVVTPTTEPAALAGQPTRNDDGGFSGFGVAVMVFGVVMVGIGAALLVLLLRRNRQAAGEPALAGGAGSAGYAGPGGYEKTAVFPTATGYPGTPAYPAAPGDPAAPGGLGAPVDPWGAQSGQAGGPPGGDPAGGDATAYLPRVQP